VGWTYTFAATKNAKNEPVILARPYFNRVLSTVAVGEEFALTITEREDKRSSKQNRLLWGTCYDQLIAGIADEVGYDRHDKHGKEQLHEGLLCLYGGMVIEPVTKREVAKVRSSKMTVAEFSAYVEWIARWAAQEHGVVIVLPGEAA
jgi:hypothetical protein